MPYVKPHFDRLAQLDTEGDEARSWRKASCEAIEDEARSALEGVGLKVYTSQAQLDDEGVFKAVVAFEADPSSPGTARFWETIRTLTEILDGDE